MSQIESSTFLHSIASPGQALSIEAVLSTLDQTLRQQAETAGLRNVRLTTEPSKHWMKMAFVYGGGQYDWKLGMQLHRNPDITGTRIDITLRYAISDDPLAENTMNDIQEKLGTAFSKALNPA